MVDWNKPIKAILAGKSYPAHLIREGDPAINEGERCFEVEITGPHKIMPNFDYEDTGVWWFNLDGSYCVSEPHMEFIHIENDK